MDFLGSSENRRQMFQSCGIQTQDHSQVKMWLLLMLLLPRQELDVVVVIVVVAKTVA